jgi:hypothetical protein
MHKRHPSSTADEAKSRMKNVLKSRLEDVGDIAWCTVFVLVALAGISWLWWTVMSMPSPR